MLKCLSLNGRLLPEKEVGIATDDRGFLLGDGLFETMRFDQGKAPKFLQHIARLQKGCHLLNLPLNVAPDDLYNQIKALLQKNHFDNKQSAIVRLTVTRGRGPRGLPPPQSPTPTILIRCFELSKKKPSSISVIHSDVPINEYSPLRQFKSLNYLENIIARHRALSAGYDDALLYNTQGFLVGTTCANIFLLMDNNQLITPSLKSGAMPGIMRQHILDLVQQTDLIIHETLISRELCERASAAFITNSLIRLVPIDRLAIRTGMKNNLLNFIKKNNFLREKLLPEL